MSNNHPSLRIHSPGLTEETSRELVVALTSGANVEWLDEGIFQVIDRAEERSEEKAVLVELDTSTHTFYLSSGECGPRIDQLLSRAKHFFNSMGSTIEISKD